MSGHSLFGFKNIHSFASTILSLILNGTPVIGLSIASTEKMQISDFTLIVAYKTSFDIPCALIVVSSDANEYAIAYVPAQSIVVVPIVNGLLNCSSEISQKINSFAGILPSAHCICAQSYHGLPYS